MIIINIENPQNAKLKPKSHVSVIISWSSRRKRIDTGCRRIKGSKSVRVLKPWSAKSRMTVDLKWCGRMMRQRPLNISNTISQDLSLRSMTKLSINIRLMTLSLKSDNHRIADRTEDQNGLEQEQEQLDQVSGAAPGGSGGRGYLPDLVSSEGDRDVGQ